MTKHLLKKTNLTELLGKFKERMELIEGLTGAQSVKQRFEYEIIIKLLENELTRQRIKEPKARKKEYLQIYYQNNQDKINTRSKEQSRKAREQSKLYEEAMRNGGL